MNNIQDISEVKIRFRVPVIPGIMVYQIIEKAFFEFIKEPNVLDINESIVIVGDLHGHLLDLLRIIKDNGLPPLQKYLFLGDTIDRGEFSFETILFIACMKVVRPECVFLLRGNHEFEEYAMNEGFQSEISSIYDTDVVWKVFMNLFSALPLAARVFSTFCVHGGIGPSVNELNEIESIKRPIKNYSSPIVRDLLWSDPSDQIQCYLPSQRGCGSLFGEACIQKFLRNCHCTSMIRSHEFVEEGIRTHHHGLTNTVFSCSNYCGSSNNVGAIIIIDGKGEHHTVFYSPLKYLKRKDVKLVQTTNESVFCPILRPPSITKLCNSKILPELGEKCKSQPNTGSFLPVISRTTPLCALGGSSRKQFSITKIEMNKFVFKDIGKKCVRKASF